MCAAQPATSNTQPATQPKHFRLTFQLTYPDGQPTQSYALDVPVSPDHPGTSRLSLSTGATGHEEGSIEQSLQCTDVHESSAGLAARVSFTMHKVDLVLGQPAQIPEETQKKPLSKDESALPAMPAAPQITITAVAL
jgi:hypothetical protein